MWGLLTTFLCCLGLLGASARSYGRQDDDDDHCHCHFDFKGGHGGGYGMSRYGGGGSGVLSARLDSVEMRVSKLLAELRDAEDALQKDEKELEEVVDGAKELLVRVERLEGSACDEYQFQCRKPLGGTGDKCISILFVCDGHSDCDSGWDEDDFVCKDRAPQGSVWEGKLADADNGCTQRAIEQFKVVVTSVHKHSWFPTHPNVDFSLQMTHHDESGALVTDVLDAHGYYNYANAEMVVQPPEDDRLGLVCRFDGVHDEVCHAQIVHEASLKSCLDFTLQRTDAHH